MSEKKRVLYAEDDLCNRRLLAIQLEREGYQCDVVENGNLALQMYSENRYDLVLLDQYMPGLDGEEVATEIRKSSPEIPLIAITSDDSLRSHLLETGFDEVIIKPLRGPEPIQLITSYLR